MQTLMDVANRVIGSPNFYILHLPANVSADPVTKKTVNFTMGAYSSAPSPYWKSLVEQVYTTIELVAAAQLPDDLDDREEADVWPIFQQKFDIITDIYSYEPVWEAYINATIEVISLNFHVTSYNNALSLPQSYINDNVQYCELRSRFGRMYRLNESLTSTFGRDEFDTQGDYEASRLQAIMNDYKERYPDKWFGCKWIYAVRRSANTEKMTEYLTEALVKREKFPDLVIGFDLVGEEDRGFSLFHFANTFENFTSSSLGGDSSRLPFYFHAGETLWAPDYNPSLAYPFNFASPRDETTTANLVDAVLRNSRRLGHGFALMRYQYVAAVAREQNSKSGYVAVTLLTISIQSRSRCALCRAISSATSQIYAPIPQPSSLTWGFPSPSHLMILLSLVTIGSRMTTISRF
jgi:hypothetical protein